MRRKRSVRREIVKREKPANEPCDVCGAKRRCVHKLVPAYQLAGPTLFEASK